MKRNEGVCLESLHLRELEAPEKAVPRGSFPPHMEHHHLSAPKGSPDLTGGWL